MKDINAIISKLNYFMLERSFIFQKQEKNLVYYRKYTSSCDYFEYVVDIKKIKVYRYKKTYLPTSHYIKNMVRRICFWGGDV